ncbi:MAG: hypothetical protein GY906_23020 [bacterium]|nr:hypothetical protein [bacterium]
MDWTKLPGLRPRRSDTMEGALPSRSYELIKMLDESMPRAQWPADVQSLIQLANPARMYTTIWQAAQRALVDNLVSRVREEIDFYDSLASSDDAAVDDADGPDGPRIDIRLGASPPPLGSS